MVYKNPRSKDTQSGVVRVIGNYAGFIHAKHIVGLKCGLEFDKDWIKFGFDTKSTSNNALVRRGQTRPWAERELAGRVREVDMAG